MASSLGPQGPIGVLLNPMPRVDVQPKDNIYDVIGLALATATKDASAFYSDLQGLDPFRHIRHLWVLGCPAAAYFNDRKIHFIDTIGDLASDFEPITLLLRPRNDITEKSKARIEMSERFGEAIGLQSLVTDLHIAVVDKILDMLTDVRFYPTIREGLDCLEPKQTLQEQVDTGYLMSQIEQIAQSRKITETLRKSMGEFMAPTIDWIANVTVGTILGRPEISVYNEFSTKFGLEFVLHGWIPFSYPSHIWREIEKGEGPTFLSEMGAKLWRFNILQQRSKKTLNMLIESDKVDDLVDKSVADNFWRGQLGASEFLKPDETLDWWFAKETIALRHYLIGVFSFPESFLAILKGEELTRYSSFVEQIFSYKKTEAENIKKRMFSEWFTLDGSKDMRVTAQLEHVFKNIPDALKVVFEPSEPSQFIQVQRQLQEEGDKEYSFALLSLYNEIRNRLVHGTNFQQASTGSLQFEHRGKRYLIDYNTLALAYHLLPSIVLRLYNAHRAHQKR